MHRRILIIVSCAFFSSTGPLVNAQAVSTAASPAESLAKLLIEFPGPPNKRFHWRKSALKSKYDKYTDSTTIWTRLEIYGGVESKNFGFTVVEKPSVDIVPIVKFQGGSSSVLPSFVTLVFSTTVRQSAKAAIKETVGAERHIKIPLIVDSARVSYDAELLDSDIDFFGSQGKSRLTYAVMLPMSEFLRLVRATKIEGRVNNAEFSIEKKYEYTTALADIFSKLQGPKEQ